MTYNYQAAIDAAAEGKTLEQIAIAMGCTYNQLYYQMENNHHFGTQLRRARELGLQLRGDQLLTMVKDNPDTDVQRLKLEADNIKWVLARLLPKVFGDRLDVNVLERVDVTLALTEAKTRLLRPGRDSEQIEDAQYVELPRQSQAQATDKQSDALPSAPAAPEFVDPFSDD